MTKGVLLFCFDTADVQYHKILERCVGLIKKNLKLEITVVTDFNTFSKLEPLGFVNYKFIEPELGNTKHGLEWRNVDRHMAYDLSPYDTTLVMDIDYFPFTDNLKKFLDTKYDFLISKHAYDLTSRNSFDMRRFSMIDMVWATVFIFKKATRQNESLKWSDTLSLIINISWTCTESETEDFVMITHSLLHWNRQMALFRMTHYPSNFQHCRRTAKSLSSTIMA